MVGTTEGAKMNAVMCGDCYGGPETLTFGQMEIPSPAKGQVLIKVAVTSVNPGDWHIMRGDPWLIRLMYGLFKPNFKVLGADVAGTVEAVGGDVTEFKVGDQVFGDIEAGGFAEYTVANVNHLVKKDPKLSFEDAAALPMAAVTAICALRNFGKIEPEMKVLVIGAAGGVGSYAVQIAKELRAEVTGVCSTGNVELVKSLGADAVVDYKKEDICATANEFDLIIDTALHRWYLDYKKILSPKGRYVLVGGATKRFFQTQFTAPFINLVSSKKYETCISMPNKDLLSYIKSLADEGKIKPLIGLRYALKDVPEAMAYVETGHAKGKVVVNISS